MSQSVNQKLKVEKITLKWNAFVSLFANNASAMNETLPKNPPKSFRKLSKHWNIISFITATDTVHVHVPIARTGKPSQQLGPLHFYTLGVVYNSQLLVLYSSQSPTTIRGYATNWNRTGWEEIYPQLRKFSLKFWQALSWCHQDNVTIKAHVS
jgi:hypothetical protein